MKIACIGAGPAGLYFAISMKLRDTRHEIHVFERNRADEAEQRRQDEAYLNLLGAQRIPDPTTAGDFCRRFESRHLQQLHAAFDELGLEYSDTQANFVFVNCERDSKELFQQLIRTLLRAAVGEMVELAEHHQILLSC